MNHALMISCGTIDLLLICRNNIVTNGRSKCDHVKYGSREARSTVVNVREGVTNQ